MAKNARDNATLNQAKGQSLPATDPSAVQPCLKQIKHLRAGVFFDGTNNNRYRDEPKGAETNVCRLLNLFISTDDAITLRRKQYIVGVGSLDDEKLDKDIAKVTDDCTAQETSLIGKATTRITVGAAGEIYYWAQKAGNLAGGAGGAGGKARLNTAYAWLKSECSSLPPEVEKTVDVFGFSRGAALARTFVNMVNQKLKPGVSNLRVRFVGVFDTVGSFGLAGNAANPGQNLAIDGGDADRIVHYCARHEYRVNFPLSSIPGYDTYYMGAHSDVGGGYAPLEDARFNHLAFIPLSDMHTEGVSAGVELNSWKPLADKASVNVDRLRKAVETFNPDIPSMYAPESDFAKKQQEFIRLYVHESANSSRWNKLHPNHPEWDGQRRVFVHSKKTIQGEPPDFDWS